MSVALSSFETACHRPCPDMPHHSLNAAQKAKGLACLQKVRAELYEKKVAPLLKRKAELEAKLTDVNLEQLARNRIEREIKQINNQGQRIKERWS